MKGKVLITGGSGLIAGHLSKKLKNNNYEVVFLSRKELRDKTFKTYTWNPENQIFDRSVLSSVDYIIHLTGANIGEKRWTKKRKREIVDSRINTGNLLFHAIKENNHPLKAFISASAVGYYGSVTNQTVYNEEDPPSNDFLALTCKRWEEMANKFADLKIRTVKIRTGIVLSKNGGIVKRIITVLKFRIAPVMGKGNQYMPWIHIDDLCNIYLKAIEDTNMLGSYNAVAPDFKTNIDFVKSFSLVFGKSCLLIHIPAVIFKLFFGEMSIILLKGSRVSPDKIINCGYNFIFPGLANALGNLIKD